MTAPRLKRSVWIAAAIAAVAFALGVIGYLDAGGVSLASAVYNTLGLFTLTFTSTTTGSTLPVALEIARFLAPVVTVLAAAGIAARLFRDEFDRLTARHRARGHVVVCGLGRVGMITAERLHAHGRAVIAIERDGTTNAVSHVRALGIPVIVGDARSRLTLHRAGIERATRLVWAAGEWVDGQAVVETVVDTLRDNFVGGEIQRSNHAPRSESVPACLVRVRDLALCTALRRRALTGDRTDRERVSDIDFFNEAENAAQRMLWRATRGYALVDDGTVELWILGSGMLAEALVVQAARNWLGLPERRRPPALIVHLFGHDADALEVRIAASWPEVAAACRLEAHPGPPELATNRVTPRTGTADQPDAAFVVVNDPERAVEIGFRLIDDTAIAHVVVAVEHRFSAHVGNERFLAFDPVVDGLDSDVLLFDTYELLARMLHAQYLETRLSADGMLDADTAQGPTHEWADLDPFWRASNRDAARFVVPNVLAAGLRIQRLVAPASIGEGNVKVALDPPTIEGMAEREHERWRRFMTAWGWRPGPRDDAARTRPDLVPWSEASDGARSVTCRSVGEYPRLLAQLGYQIEPRVEVAVGSEHPQR